MKPTPPCYFIIGLIIPSTVFFFFFLAFHNIASLFVFYKYVLMAIVLFFLYAWHSTRLEISHLSAVYNHINGFN